MTTEIEIDKYKIEINGEKIKIKDIKEKYGKDVYECLMLVCLNFDYASLYKDESPLTQEEINRIVKINNKIK